MEEDTRSGLHTFADLVRAQEVRDALPAAPAAPSWTAAGPTNIGGRMTAVVVHPDQPDVLWAGAAGGGVWRSLDAGRDWKPLWHDQKSLVVGSLALDPRDPKWIYCGTGETNFVADSYPGAGLYRSTDGGDHWTLLATPRDQGIPTRIGTIAVDPFDPRHILIGGVSSSFDDAVASAGGLYSSFDGGTTWKRETFVSSGPHRCHAVLFHPRTQGTIFAAFAEGGAQSGIWRLRAGEAQWTHLTVAGQDPEAFDRTSLAIAPSDPRVIYALAADPFGEVLGVFRSDDGGDSWQDAGAGHFGNIGKINYANTIAVHPKDASFVICGGEDLHLTLDGGRGRWIQATRGDLPRGHFWYAHPDHHALAIVAPGSAGARIYDLNDGGMDVSENGGQSWENRSNGLAVTQYYTLDVAAGDERRLGGGTQDNGTLITLTGKSDDHFEVFTGDGGGIAFDPIDPDHFFVSAQKLDIRRWRERVETVPSTPPAPGDAGVFLTLLALSPQDSKIALTASDVIFKTVDDGVNWKQIQAEFDRYLISAIEATRADPQRVYLGTQGGGFFRSDNGGGGWSWNLAGSTLPVPGKPIMAIESDPANADLVLLGLAGFGNRHLFGSSDGGRHWKDLDGGHLPDAPINSLVIPLAIPDTVFAAGDAGVFRSDLRGTAWQSLTANLPNVRVTALVYHERSQTLFAATYGRGVWKLKVP
ncbi:MAG: WD40/YVTN/BNR-like repeat-containing protein [Thermoanaerobaculia bacterium]